MINIRTIYEYRRLRKLGFLPRSALRYAKTNIKFELMEDKNLVRLRIVVDEMVYDDSYLDTWDSLQRSQLKRIRANLWDRIKYEGVWGVVGEFLNENDEWEHSDSCFGFIGDEWQDSGYDSDIKFATLVNAAQAQKKRQFDEHYV